jgi:hypothetical protein
MVPPLWAEATFLWTLALLALIATVGPPDLAALVRRSGVVRVFMVLLGVCTVTGGTAVEALLPEYLRANPGNEPVLYAFGSLGAVAIGVGVAAILLMLRAGFGVPSGPETGAEEGTPDSPAGGGAPAVGGAAGLFYWLALRVFVSGVAVICMSLVFHLVFLIWLGGAAVQQAPGADASTIPIVRFEF